MAGDMAHKAVLAKPRLNRRVIGPSTFVETERNIEVLQQAVERVPISRMPVTPIDIVRPYEGADRSVILDTAVKLLAGEVDVVYRHHRRHPQLVRAVLHEIVQPVIVGAADRS